MSESIPAALVIAAFLLITAVTFFFLQNIWVEHDTLQSDVAAYQQAKISTSLGITSTEMSPDYCPNYAGPYDATVKNEGQIPISDFSHTDVFVEYLDDGDNKVVALLEHGTDWSVTDLTPDDRNPNQWDPEESAAIQFSLTPSLKPGSNGVFLITSPDGISDAGYFTCTIECGTTSTGFRSPTIEAADSGGSGDGFETTPTNAFSDDGLPAVDSQVLLSGDNHQFYGYGISIHQACEIQGIEVQIDWWLLSDLGDNSMDVELSWDGGSTWTAAKTDTQETTLEHTAVLGGPSDTWGHDWSPSEFSDTLFRVRITNNASVLPQDFNLDWVAVNVHYDAP